MKLLTFIATDRSRGTFNKQQLAGEKLFSDAVKYILISNTPIDILLSEILGLKSCPCNVVIDLVNDVSWFYKGISTEITHLICLCYLKENYIFYNNVHVKLNCQAINEWLHNHLEIAGFTNFNFVIELENLLLIKVKEDSLVFKKQIMFIDVEYCHIKFNKFTKYISGNVQSFQPIHYTNRPNKLNLGSVDHNGRSVGNGRCLGLANYWLENMQLSYQGRPSSQLKRFLFGRDLQSGNCRRQLKDNYVNSVSVTIVNQRSILKYETELRILQLQCGFYINDNFVHIQDIYSNSSIVAEDLFRLPLLMKLNNLDNLYVQLITANHAIGLMLHVVVNLSSNDYIIKLLFYDSNNQESLYGSILFDTRMHNVDILCVMLCQIPYFMEQGDRSFDIILKCYSGNRSITEYQNINDNFAELYKCGTCCWEQSLRFGIIIGDKNLVNLALTFTTNVPDAFILACATGNVQILQILLNNETIVKQCLNYIDHEGCSALILSKRRCNKEMYNLLLSAIDDHKLMNSYN